MTWNNRRLILDTFARYMRLRLAVAEATGQLSQCVRESDDDARRARNARKRERRAG